MGLSKTYQGGSIQLDNYSRSYFAGEMVKGRPIVSIPKQIKAKEVTITLDGVGRTSWSEARTRTVHRNGKSETESYTVIISSAERYVKQRTRLAGDGHTFSVLEPGTLTYPFHFVLPTNLPSSFTSFTGKVSYVLKLKVKRPTLKWNIGSIVPFTVNGIFDLNLEPAAANQQEMEGHKGSNFCVGRKGKMGFVLILPRSGFVPGEFINFSAEVSNNSNKKITELKGSFLQVCKYYAEGRTQKHSKCMYEVMGPEVDKGDHELWISQPGLRIPPVPPTKLGGTLCRIIDVQYFLQFQVKVAGLSTTLTGMLPVMIGTIPLRSTFEQLRPPESLVPPIPVGREIGFDIRNEPVAGPSHQSLSPPPPLKSALPSTSILPDYPDLPPPSYAEAVETENFTWNKTTDEKKDGRNDDDENNGEGASNKGASAPPIDEYIPSYVTYHKE